MNTSKASPLSRAIAGRARRWLDGETDARAQAQEQPGQTTAATRAAVVDAMQQHLCDHYTRRPGVAALCHAVVSSLAALGVDVDAEEGIVITGGADETRFVAVRTLAAGQHVFLPQAAMETYQMAFTLAGVDATPLDLDAPLPEASGGLLILPTLDPSTRQPLTSAQLAQVEEWVRAHDLTVVADEINTPLLGTADAQPFAARQDMASRTLTLGGFAHAPALLAWRVAWFAGPAPLVGKVRALKQAMTICSPAPGQYAALATLEKGD